MFSAMGMLSGHNCHGWHNPVKVVLIAIARCNWGNIAMWLCYLASIDSISSVPDSIDTHHIIIDTIDTLLHNIVLILLLLCLWLIHCTYWLYCSHLCQSLQIRSELFSWWAELQDYSHNKIRELQPQLQDLYQDIYTPHVSTTAPCTCR
jgi:hypothetical protein